MKINAESREGNIVTFEIEVDADHTTKTYKQAFRQQTKDIKVPGFRKGKVPNEILKSMVNTDKLKKDVLEYLVSEACSEAINEKLLETISNPAIEILEDKDGQPLKFKARIEIKPDITLGEYRDMQLEATVDERITDENVDREVDILKYKAATLVPVEERAIKMGDVVTMNTEGFVDGQPIPLGKVENLQVEIKEGNLLPGFTEQLIGTNLNEEREIPITLPADYNWVELRGKEATFKTQILEIKEFQFPELNDEFAKTVGAEFQTLDDLKNAIRKHLETSWEEAQQIKIHRVVLDKIIENATLEVPESMISRELLAMWYSADGKVLREQKMDEDLLKKSWENWQQREDIKLEAVRRIKTTLVLGAIAKKEEIAVTQQELETELTTFAYERKMTPEQLQSYVNDRNKLLAFMDELLSLKIIGWVVENNKVNLLDEEGNIVENIMKENEEEEIQTEAAAAELVGELVEAAKQE